MTTEIQAEANRRNALQSTGPKTGEGIEAARFNALRHGLRALQTVVPGEDPEEWEAHRAAVDLKPEGAVELALAEVVAPWPKLPRGDPRRDRGDDQGRLAREGEVIVRSLLRDRLRPLRGGRLALGDKPSAQPTDHEGSRHAVEPCERNKKGLMVEPLRVHWIAPAESVLRPPPGWIGQSRSLKQTPQRHSRRPATRPSWNPMSQYRSRISASQTSMRSSWSSGVLAPVHRMS